MSVRLHYQLMTERERALITGATVHAPAGPDPDPSVDFASRRWETHRQSTLKQAVEQAEASRAGER